MYAQGFIHQKDTNEEIIEKNSKGFFFLLFQTVEQ